MLYPSIDKLLNIVDSKYILVYAASIRSKQMLEEKHFQMRQKDYKNKRELGRALEEIEKGYVKVYKNSELREQAEALKEKQEKEAQAEVKEESKEVTKEEVKQEKKEEEN